MESPVKIAQLLQSGLFELDGNNLIEKETQESLKISDFTLNRIPQQIREEFAKKAYIFKLQNSPPKDGATVRENMVQSKASFKSPQKSPCRTSRSPFSLEGKVKGLKEFRKKIL